MAAPVLVGMMFRAAAHFFLVTLIQDDLVIGVGVDSGHDGADDTKAIVHDLGSRREAVGGAGSIRNDVVNRTVVLFFIDTQNDRQILALGRCRNDDFFSTSARDMRISADLAAFAFGVGEDAGALKNDIHTKIFPGQIARIFFCKNSDFLAIDHKVAGLIDINVTLVDAVV